MEPPWLSAVARRLLAACCRPSLSLFGGQSARLGGPDVQAAGRFARRSLGGRPLHLADGSADSADGPARAITITGPRPRKQARRSSPSAWESLAPEVARPLGPPISRAELAHLHWRSEGPMDSLAALGPLHSPLWPLGARRSNISALGSQLSALGASASCEPSRRSIDLAPARRARCKKIAARPAGRPPVSVGQSAG